MNKVEEEFQHKAIRVSTLLLYSKLDALCFVERCKIHKIIILGIDGFFINEQLTQPSLDDSIDYSSIPFSKSVYENAIKFLEERNDNLYFEIVTSE